MNYDMNEIEERSFPGKFLKYIIIILIISIPFIFLVFQVIKNSEIVQKKEIISNLSLDADLLAQQFDQHITNIISELNILILPNQDNQKAKGQIVDLMRRRTSIFHINYFSADGNIMFASTKTKLEWQSNLLNRTWYRQLIKEWKPILSSVHKSPISPFPLVISLAVPKIVEKKIDGFWLIYLDLKKINTLFPTVESSKKGKYSIWFDPEGIIIKTGKSIANELTQQSIKDNRWWFTINEVSAVDNDSIPDLLYVNSENETAYFYSTAKSIFGNLQLLMVQNQDNAMSLFYSLKNNILLLATILQIIFLIVTGVILNQWEKRKYQLQLVQQQSDELKNVNVMLETKTRDLLETNKKSEQLTNELLEQKEGLLQLNNKLARLEKYLNFLTVPVFTMDDNYKINFVNRACEIEFGQSVEKIQGKHINKLLKNKDEKKLKKFFALVKKENNRHEYEISFNKQNFTKQYLLSCDYLAFPEWTGFIISMVDLTDLLTLQNNIKTQNIFLDSSSKLIETFLHIDDNQKILLEALKNIKQFSNAEAVCFYQLEGESLVLQDQFPVHYNDHFKEIPIQNSICGGALSNNKPVIIENKDSMPQNFEPYEKKWNFKAAIFNPIIINNKSIGVLVIMDPLQKFIKDYENTLSGLIMYFEIGLSALLSHKNLEKSTEYRAQLLRSTTHALNTPLSTIMGYLKLLKLKFGDVLTRNPEFNDYIVKLDLAAEDMTHKTHMYLDLARINRNDLKFDFEKISISSLLQPVLDLLIREAKERSVEIGLNQNNIKGNNIFIDKKRIVFALKTIFLNALRFAPPNDKVQFDINCKGSQLIIRMEDHGPEIKMEHIALIGSEFLSPDLSNARIHHVNNQEMALSVKLIRLIKGELKIESSKNNTVHTAILPV